MARTLEELIQTQIGGQALQLARLVVELDTKDERIKELEKELDALKEKLPA